jgi:hypothetical protein
VHGGPIVISVNYRFVAEVPMETIAKSGHWAYGHTGEYGGDPSRAEHFGVAA